jgi:hypothetical protein
MDSRRRTSCCIIQHRRFLFQWVRCDSLARTCSAHRAHDQYEMESKPSLGAPSRRVECYCQGIAERVLEEQRREAEESYGGLSAWVFSA